MKKLLAYLAPFMCFTKCYSQHYVISTSDGNIVYVGLGNLLRVAVNEYPCNAYYLETDNGSIQKDDTSPCFYLFSPDSAGTAHIDIYLTKNNKKIGSDHFRVKQIPQPIAKITGQNGGKILKNILAIQMGIAAELPATTLNTNFTVANYRLTIYENDSLVYSACFKGNIFPVEVKERFKSLKKNDRVLFSNMNYLSYDKSIKPLAPIEFIISD